MKKILVGILLLVTFAGGLLTGRYVFPSPSSVDSGYATVAELNKEYFNYKTSPGAKNLSWIVDHSTGAQYWVVYGEGDRKGEPRLVFCE